MLAYFNGSRRLLRSARSVPKGGTADDPRKVYKFTKRGRNGGEVAASEKRDRALYDYSDEM